MSFWVYILASARNGTLYVGQTDDLPKRIHEHREGLIPGFTARYGVKMLVYLEAFPTREKAKVRERRIKEWKRAWKLRLIETENPEWKGLYLDLNNWNSRTAS